MTSTSRKGLVTIYTLLSVMGASSAFTLAFPPLSHPHQLVGFVFSGLLDCVAVLLGSRHGVLKQLVHLAECRRQVLGDGNIDLSKDFLNHLTAKQRKSKKYIERFDIHIHVRIAYMYTDMFMYLYNIYILYMC